MISITIERLTKRFGQTVALSDINLNIQAGEIFFLLGPSGCGKTTLLRGIAGFNVPDEGRILFANDDVTNLPPHKRNTGMMFQSYALWPHLTVAKNVAFGLEERNLPKNEINQRVEAALDAVQMGKYAARGINELSGGQQQRVALARAMVIRPRCLLLDEPLSNLDAKLRLEMRTEIRRVCKEYGLTAIYVTHDQKEALSISDRMAVLDSGRVAQVGAPAEVYRRPVSKLVAGFIGETNFLTGMVESATAGEIHVSTPEGMFSGVTGDPSWTPRVGEKATVSIRPECWTLQAGGAAPAINGLSGRLADTAYLGELAQHEFRIGADGHGQIKIYELNPRFLSGSSAGVSADALVATVKSEDVVVLQG